MLKKELKPENQKQDIIHQVAEKLKLQISPKLADLAYTFAKNYYANVPLEDLTETSLKILVASVYEMWNFILSRAPGQAKIRVLTEKKEILDHTVSKTVIEIVNDNMPFLVDSVSGAINSLGYTIHLMIHPVMKVERDENQSLKAIFERPEEKERGQYESFIHCEILEACSAKKIKILEETITQALEDVRAAVQDWMPMRKRLRGVIKELKKHHPHVPSGEIEEILAFLEWIEDNHFTFLGFCEYSLIQDQSTIKRSLVPQEGLGILKNPSKQDITQLFGDIELTPSNRRYLVEPTPLIVTKTTQVSLVHRRDPMDSITVKRFNDKGKVVGIYQFIGLFTSVAYNRSARDIPLLRQKISHIIVRSGFAEEWHDGKTLIHILESLPRDELFQASEDWLFETSMAVLQLQNRQRLTLFIRHDKFERFVSCIVYVPRDRYGSELREKIAAILEKRLNGKITNWQTQLGELAFARIHFTLKLLQKGALSYNLKAIENELVESSLTWRDHLFHALISAYGEEKAQKLFDRYGAGFSRGYQERFNPEEAITDIKEIEHVLLKSRLRARLSQVEGRDKSQLRFKIYSLGSPVSLSEILPVLENMSLRVLSEIPFIVALLDNQKIWIHDFEMQTQEGEPVELNQICENFLQGFSHIWHEDMENDGFNRLIIRANFEWRECQLIRAYAKYIRQLQVTFSQAYMEETLAKYPAISHLIFQLFNCQFFPSFKGNREKKREEILNQFKALTAKVANLDEDRILTKFVNAITSTLRTNYYQLKDGKPKPYVSFKIDCAAIDEMPLPRPLYEIFVYSPRVEAVHLRGGKVARGGIRWSDRKEDFRTEVLGLMKAQMVKNAVIIPVGSKGGFIVKRLPLKEDREALMNEVIFCYKTMMQGLLDLTDNIKGQDIISPPQVIRRDGDDTYLVVAADKGTATFSDYANHVSAEYNFWLGDAFASGGSIGYDHKKMGITARGAWESVKRHFRELGIDVSREEITVIGIGDMSGDVFGNGMLLSRHLKLLAAFNHLHIFVDPTPDPEKSYEERKRLFELSRSTWADYNPDLISQGGGVFERALKSIQVTPEMRTLLGIQSETLTPSELIRHLLKAPIDLLWFGGIGTFIKAKSETNIGVEDRVNDALRVDGAEVRAKVIVEGANLGVTQLGRIEYAKNGGRINTDALDNSAGVDCSDHEVNIKILLGQAVAKDELSLEKRNHLLEQMTKDVVHHVLKDNFWQNQVISLTRSQGLRLLDEQARLMRDLESEGLLNRVLENLPDETEIARRIADKQGLTRPELAVLLAYAKISLKNYLIHSDFPDAEILQLRLFSYFPERLHQPYQEEIKTHPLRREIIVTLFTNSIVNQMGITFVHEMKRQLTCGAPDVARAYIVVRELLDLVSLWDDLEAMESLPATFQTELMLSIYEKVKRCTDWFIRFNSSHQDLEKVIQFFSPGFKTLKEDVPAFFSSQQSHLFEEKRKEYEALGLSSSLAESLLVLEPLVSVPDIIILSKDTHKELKMVARIYFALGQLLGFEWLRKTVFGLSGDTHWHQGAANALIEDLYVSQKLITHKVLVSGKPLESLFQEDGTLIKDMIPTAAVEPVLFDLMNAATVDFPMITVINRQLRMLAQVD